ncbi:predicted protein [Naegleria gruberi]|uniref:Predicted protein n=1 Tax=Naegleria gruberi TaxID=5762 RepID=D2W561_NAEGR|nr:uncharacterized protein NAEGRDRAFT_76549 [Naegleria gruberi]EFC35792.1 predicted protein [Naegleria gruberi]|eukprot:XP_002668536.1 predicted protein [Naegleria gruberi strain NEG-M]
MSSKQIDKYPRFLKTTHPPPNSSGLMESNPEKPLSKLKIEYIHGCSKKGCYGNVFHVDDEQHLVYPAAGCGVVLNVEDNTQKVFCKHDDDVVALAKHPNGRYFASGQMGKDDMIYIWDSHQPEAGPIKALKTNTQFKNGGVLTCCFSTEGSLLACVGGSPKMNIILIYDWNKGTCLANVKGTNEEVYALCFSKR